ncbi:MAG: PEP-CTERM sorting domain-containing protein [Opitutaceae bacterium]|nr:PEP-CTERM sorting domain-containing protein [Cephaloticoccus sp.]MCP5529159.1 PEP-CTERM sorting domain-containing protein [Opitutaceae bacterium]
MKTILHRLATGLFVAALLSTTAFAQTFPGSDDFSAGESAKWDDEVIRFAGATSDGNLGFANGWLEYTKAATAGGTVTNQFIRWNSGNGTSPDMFSYTTSWVMTVDVTNTVVGGALTSIGIQVSNYNNDGYASIYLAESGNSTDVYARATGTGLSAVSSGTFSDNTDITLRFDWDASNQILSSSYAIDGTTFTSLASYAVGGWSTAPTDGFVMGIWAQSSIAAEITSGQLYADNFAVSAVPEPSTYAAIAGALMLGFAAWKRRGKRA